MVPPIYRVDMIMFVDTHQCFMFGPIYHCFCGSTLLLSVKVCDQHVYYDSTTFWVKPRSIGFSMGFPYSPGHFFATLSRESLLNHQKFTWLILRPLKARSILVEQTTPVAHLIADAFWQRWCLERWCSCTVFS